MSKDLHDLPFDEGTKAKLKIFSDYIKSWLPVFLASKITSWENINIFDFFAGPGADVTGYNGTPIIIINELSSYFKYFEKKRINLHLYFNEFNQNKFSLLNKKIEQLESNNKFPYKISIDNLDFKEAFEKHYTAMKLDNTANLILLDQSGIKHITPEIFQQIVNLKTTDFLFFISSSTIRRFSELDTIKQYIDVSKEKVEATEYFKTHQLILEYYQSLLPSSRSYYLAPFSIKKGANIYGLIFGSGHVLGIEKFLSACWKADPDRGEANFDIDKENILPNQLSLFTGKVQQPKKVDVFENELRNRILDKRIVTDENIYLFTITMGFLPKHARKVLKFMIKDGKIKKKNFLLGSDIVKASTPKIKLELIENGN
ncbi:MAG: three-Cys-motif partner protein TcmP [Ignavibacteriales bacterium]|nr:three-Cys-motif partner protein TcmP [Ignavibacteriales bacterium]